MVIIALSGAVTALVIAILVPIRTTAHARSARSTLRVVASISLALAKISFSEISRDNCCNLASSSPNDKPESLMVAS